MKQRLSLADDQRALSHASSCRQLAVPRCAPHLRTMVVPLFFDGQHAGVGLPMTARSGHHSYPIQGPLELQRVTLRKAGVLPCQ